MKVATLQSEGRNLGERCYTVCRTGPDLLAARPAFWLVRRTWIRWTRFVPQTLARVLLVPFVASSIVADAGAGNLHPIDWPDVLIETALTLSLVAILNGLADRTWSLNSYAPTSRALRTVRRVLDYRGGYFVISTLILGITVGLSPGAYGTWASVVTVVSYYLGLYCTTMGRPNPPAKKVRERLVVRLPRLARSWS